MSEVVPAPVLTARARWRSIPEVAANEWSLLWWFLLFVVILPVWVIVRSEGEPQALGLMWLYAGAVGVFVVIRRQYVRVLKWQTSFPSFLNDSPRAADEIAAFASRPWHLHPACVFFCTFFTCAALLLFYRGGLFQYPSKMDVSVAMTFVAVASYICGVGLSAVFHMMRLVRQLGNFDVYVLPHPFGIVNVGAVLMRVFLETALIWCFYTATAAACRESWLLPSMGLALPAVLFFGFAFVGAQLPLHRAMVAYKEKQVGDLEQTLRRLEPPLGSSVSEDALRQIEFFERRLRSALELPEWPFRWPSFFAVLGSAAATVIAPIVSSALTSALDVAMKVQW